MSWRYTGYWILACLLVGCRSAPPRLALTGARLEPVSTAAPSSASKLARLDESAFTQVAPTNALRSEWLQPPTNLFRLGPGDVITIENLGEPAAGATTAVVGPDGKIYYSLLPGISVWGLTLTETKELLEKELSRFTRVKPELSVTLRTVGSKRCWILGSVTAPGVYSLATPMTLLEAITLAGGPVATPGSASGMPDLRKSFVLRNGQPLPVDFTALLTRGDFSQNIYLQPDDLVYLKASPVPDVYVLGAVRAPTVLPYSDRLSLLSAIAAAGGTIEYANVWHVAVVRGALTAPRIALVDYRAIRRGAALDVRLEPGDVVYVPFVPFRPLAVLAQAVVRQLALQLTANAAYDLVYPNAFPVAPGVPVGQPITPPVTPPPPVR
jgi:protein involved in polysaccharide export with SLBB domain